MEEDIKILENIKEYMQNQINNGYHKFIYNDLGWDEKCIDVINAIENIISRNKELKEENKELQKYIKDYLIPKSTINLVYIPKSKVKEKIEELKEDEEFYREQDRMYEFESKIKLLQELLEE